MILLYKKTNDEQNKQIIICGVFWNRFLVFQGHAMEHVEDHGIK